MGRFWRPAHLRLQTFFESSEPEARSRIIEGINFSLRRLRSQLLCWRMQHSTTQGVSSKAADMQERQQQRRSYGQVFSVPYHSTSPPVVRWRKVRAPQIGTAELLERSRLVEWDFCASGFRSRVRKRRWD